METQQPEHVRQAPVSPRTAELHAQRLNMLNLWLAALIAVAVLSIIAVLLLRMGDGKKVSLPPAGRPAAVSEAQLKALAAKVKQPIYWAGPKSGVYELTQTAGRVYIRYLPSTDKVGDRAARYLTIGTYSTKNAFRALRRAAARPGAVSLGIDDGGLLVFNAKTPRSVYFGYPGGDYQVEVYDPSPQEARTLVLQGKIKPIE